MGEREQNTGSTDRSEYKTIVNLQQGETNERFYTYCIVSYASLDEIRPLLQWAKEWAYIKHDKDENRGIHYHIMVAFEKQKSYRQLFQAVKSDQNTFVQGLKRAVGNMLAYFTHTDEASTKAEKYQYSEEDIVYSDFEYWSARLNWHTDKIEVAKNESFFEDLLDKKSTIESMGRKYGRDFMKNIDKYWSYRTAVIDERKKALEMDMDGVPEETDEYSGKIIKIHAVLTRAEYNLINELRFKENQIS